jgi:hypothetical protein
VGKLFYRNHAEQTSYMLVAIVAIVSTAFLFCGKTTTTTTATLYLRQSIITNKTGHFQKETGVYKLATYTVP